MGLEPKALGIASKVELSNSLVGPDTFVGDVLGHPIAGLLIRGLNPIGRVIRVRRVTNPWELWTSSASYVLLETKNQLGETFIYGWARYVLGEPAKSPNTWLALHGSSICILFGPKHSLYTIGMSATWNISLGRFYDLHGERTPSIREA